jgi:hypothetical protein
VSLPSTAVIHRCAGSGLPMPIPPDARYGPPGLCSLCAASLRHRACAQRHGLAPWAWATPSSPPWREEIASVFGSRRNRTVRATPPLAPRRPLRRPGRRRAAAAAAVYIAGEALQALGGSRGRRERARVPSTAGEPSRLCISPARPSRPSAAHAVGGNARGFPRPRASHPGCAYRRRGPPGPRRLTRSEGTRKGSLDRGRAIQARSNQ